TAAAADSEAPALVYADWLEDQGETDRAELIRAQVRQANMSYRDPHWAELWRNIQTLEARCVSGLPVSGPLKAKRTFAFNGGVASAALNRDSGLTEANLDELAQLPSLKTLSVTDHFPLDALRRLARYPNIQSLAFNNPRRMTAEHFAALRDLPHLE